MSVIFHKRIKKEIEKYSKENFAFPNLKLAFDESNVMLWYGLINGLEDTIYDKGEYLFKIILNPEYPLKAIDFIFITPSGRFDIGKKICTTFSQFHPGDFRAAWNILSLSQAIISLLLEDGIEYRGIGYIDLGEDKRKELAIKSKEFNNENEIYNKYFV
jgi:ubiquitin-protein ligase